MSLSRSCCARVHAFLLSLAALCALPAIGRADDADAASKRFAREQLLRTAAQAVEPSSVQGPGLEELRDAVEQHREALAASPAAAPLLAAADSLIGREGDDGLVAQAARLNIWLREEAPAGAELLLVDLSGKAPPREMGAELPVELTDSQRDLLRRHALRLKMRAEDGTIPVPGIDSLRASAKASQAGAAPAFRRALVLPDELSWEVCRVLSRAYVRQAEVRREAYGLEAPKGHVNEGTVREKRERAERARKRESALIELRTRLDAALDDMVAAERYWRRKAGRIGFQVEDAKRREAGGEPAPASDLPFAALELEELVAEQELRLLYLAVRRVEVRIALIGEAQRAIEGEVLAADAAFRRFDEELSRIRRERQLDRLRYDASELSSEIKDIRQELEGQSEDLRPAWESFTEGLAALLKMNELTASAVQIRQRLETNASRAPARAAVVENPCEPGAHPTSTAPKSNGAPAEANGAPDPLAEFRAPSPEAIDEAYVKRALPRLEDDDWGIGVVAANYQAVDDMIVALRKSLRQAEAIDPLQARYAEELALARQRLDAALANSKSLDIRYRARDALQRHLPATNDAFEETRLGIADQRRRVKERYDALVYFREQLTELGEKSLGIREQRRLTPERIRQAADESAAALARIKRWVLMEGEDHLGSFAVAHWLGLLLCTAFLATSLLGVRFLRGRIDQRLQSLAARIPELRRSGVGISAEDESARREQAEKDAALAAAAEALTAGPQEAAGAAAQGKAPPAASTPATGAAHPHEEAGRPS